MDSCFLRLGHGKQSPKEVELRPQKWRDSGSLEQLPRWARAPVLSEEAGGQSVLQAEPRKYGNWQSELA